MSPSQLVRCLLSTSLHTMFSIIQDNQAVISTAWMIILSIIPSDLVRTGAILLGGVICVFNIAHAMSPNVLIEKLLLRLLCLEGKLQADIDCGIMAEAGAIFTVQIERGVGRIRYRTFELHERTLSTSGVFQEIKAVWQGNSLEIIECFRHVDTLERELERNRAMVLKNRYRWYM